MDFGELKSLQSDRTEARRRFRKADIRRIGALEREYRRLLSLIQTRGDAEVLFKQIPFGSLWSDVRRETLTAWAGRCVSLEQVKRAWECSQKKGVVPYGNENPAWMKWEVFSWQEVGNASTFDEAVAALQRCHSHGKHLEKNDAQYAAAVKAINLSYDEESLGRVREFLRKNVASANTEAFFELKKLVDARRDGF